MINVKECPRCKRVSCDGPGDKCRGKRVFRVVRWCCTSFNCFDCLHQSGRVQVEQYRTVDESKAIKVAQNWRAYGATVEEVR